MSAKTTPPSEGETDPSALGGLMFGSLQNARAVAGAGIEAWSRGLNRSGRAGLAAHALNSDYADRFFKLNLEAIPRVAPGAAGSNELNRSLSVSGQWVDLYVRYLRDCGKVLAKALSDEGP